MFNSNRTVAEFTFRPFSLGHDPNSFRGELAKRAGATWFRLGWTIAGG